MCALTIRNSAEDLRSRGKTYDEISAALNVSKGTISLWLRELPTPQRSTAEAKRAYFLAHVQRKGAAANRQKKERMWETLRLEAKRAVTAYSD